MGLSESAAAMRRQHVVRLGHDMPNMGGTCPLCGHDGPHEHTPQEMTIYSNGVKAGMLLMQNPPRPPESKDPCEVCGIRYGQHGSYPTCASHHFVGPK